MLKHVLPYGVPIYENLKDAKDFMKIRVAQKMQKEASELSTDEVEMALTQPKFLEIQRLLASKLNYMLSFTRFHFEHKAKIMGLPEEGWTLEKLLREITTKRWISEELSNPIDWFAAQEEVNGANPFEALTDEIDSLYRNKEAKWIVNVLPGPLRIAFRELPKPDQQRLFNQAHILKDLGSETIVRLVKEISAFSSWKVLDLIAYIVKFVTAYSNVNVKETIKKLNALQPQAGILYMNDGFLALSVRTEHAQKELCSIANWCINRGAFKQYAASAIQINIFDFNTTTDDPLFLTGTTVNYNKQITSSSDINNKSIISGKTISEHLGKLGYSQALIQSIEKEFESEVAIKKIVYALDLDKKQTPERVFFKISQIGNSFPEIPNEATMESLFIIIKESVTGKIEKLDLLELYKKLGILNQVSALIFNKLIGLFSPLEIKQIVEASIRNFDRLSDIQKKSPNLLNSVALNMLSQKDLVLDQLKKLNLDEIL